MELLFNFCASHRCTFDLYVMNILTGHVWFMSCQRLRRVGRYLWMIASGWKGVGVMEEFAVNVIAIPDCRFSWKLSWVCLQAFFNAFASSDTYFVAAITKKCILKTRKHLLASSSWTHVMCAVYIVTKFQPAKCMDIYIYIYIYIQGVPGGMWNTSGECSLC